MSDEPVEPDAPSRTASEIGEPMDPRPDAEEDRPHVSEVQRQPAPYTESQVIMTTVKVVAPFVFTYGLFVTFHGGESPGGGFQGGAVVASVVLMIAFAFGIESTREWVANSVLTALATGGVAVFAGLGLAGIALGGTFLEYARLPIPHPVKWGMEGVEIGGIALIVASVLVGLFFLLAAGYRRADETDAIADGGRASGASGKSEDDTEVTDG